MKKARGFILAAELLLFGLCALLLASAAASFSSCLRLQQQSADLQTCFERAQQVLYAEENAGTEDGVSRQLLEYGGLRILEVRVRHGQTECSLLQTAAQAQGLLAR